MLVLYVLVIAAGAKMNAAESIRETRLYSDPISATATANDAESALVILFLKLPTSEGDNEYGAESICETR